MKVHRSQIRNTNKFTYTMWYGNIQATVFIHNDFNCCWSAAIIIEERMGGLRAMTWNPGFECKTQNTEVDMKTWIAARLTELSTDGDGSSLVTGLLEN